MTRTSGKQRDTAKPQISGLSSFFVLSLPSATGSNPPLRHAVRVSERAELNFREAQVSDRWAGSKGWAFRSRPLTAHDEEMGESCERCGRPGKPCSIHDPTTSGKWKTLTLCDQCHGAIRQMDVRACKWFSRYCAPRNPATFIFKTNH